MRMLKVRKKSISLIVVLTFLMTLFPLALPAFAADYTRLGAVVSVDDDANVELNTVKVKSSEGELKTGDVVIVTLPKDFDFNWDTDGTTLTGTDATKIDVEELDSNELKLTVKEAFSLTEEGLFYINLKNVYVDEGYEGDIPLEFNAPSGSGFDDGSVVVGRVTGGEVTVEVTDDETFSDDGGEVTLRIEEDRAGALEVDAESVKFILPDGFEWNNASISKTIFGEGLTASLDEDAEELALNVTDASTKATCIEITAEIIVADEDDADLGDVVAKVKGESKVTPSEITVGSYGDYSVDVKADDPTTVYAGQVEQEIADFTIEEGIANSLVDGRSITLTLPEWAKWGALPEQVEDGVELNLVGYPGKDGQTAKYVVYNEGEGAAELEFEDMEVVLSPDAPEGDLEVEIGGTATDEVTIKVAEVKKPVAVTVEDAPAIVIGKAAQPIGDITITEAEAEMLKEGENLVLELPKDVEWDDYEVEVTDGDIELGDIDDDNELLTIEIEDASNDASTIKVTGTVTAFRTVPEGEVKVDVYGDAVIEVNDPDVVEDYYSEGAPKAVKKADEDSIWLNGYVLVENYDPEEGLWEDDTTIASVKAAYVATPAPGETQIKAVFTLGSTTYTLNDVAQTMDVAPYAKDGRTYLPMRYVAQALGIKSDAILWKAGTATFISGNKVVSVTIGSKIMYINGAAVPIDAAPEIVNGRTMLPIRWIATAFGVDVTWDAASQTVTVQ